MEDFDALKAAADITLIAQLVLIERESRDLGRWAQMRDCFLPDSRVRLSWFDGSGEDFVRGSRDMAARKILATHRLDPVVVRVAGERAVACLSAIIDIPCSVGGVDMLLSSHARFVYRVERREKRWRIFSFDAIYVRDEFSTAIPGTVAPVSFADTAAYRSSYRMLSFLLTSQGYQVNNELPGIDRVATADALYSEVYKWARIEY